MCPPSATRLHDDPLHTLVTPTHPPRLSFDFLFYPRLPHVKGRCDGGEVKLQVDLKGVMYNGWVLPLAATAMVLNIGPTEAKASVLPEGLLVASAGAIGRGSEDHCGSVRAGWSLHGHVSVDGRL